ncbi:hypothetical protein SUGI_0636000 [Cryptomeria japonica]|nr:hypothetical protein SUGI_0636000 [Cryptomeria japonica]
MAMSKVISRVFFATSKLLRVKELTVDASANLLYNSGFQIHKYSLRNMFPHTILDEKYIESIISTSDGLIVGHLAIRLNVVLQAVELPACISDLDPGLPNVDRNALPPFENFITQKKGGGGGGECIAVKANNSEEGVFKDTHSPDILTCTPL